MYDILIIGGGINGCGIARDAAGRGYSVYLAEQDDLACGTSSGSTKLIHGGLRYLEHFEFRLVRESLQEREVLWRMAPHIIWPLRFILPHTKGLRPAWLLRLGLFLYDHIGGRKLLPGTSTIDLRRSPYGAALHPVFSKAFEYSDCWVEDSRLVALNARDAADRGAIVRTRTRVTHVERQGSYWQVTLRDRRSGEDREVHARFIINASGPWVDQVIGQVVGHNDAHNVRLVQGSHIVVPKLYDHDHCYFFQNSDGRIFFAIRYEQDFTLIGTTDRDFDGVADDVTISDEEIEYLVDATNVYFKQSITRDDIVWSYSAVRPLYDDGASKAQEATRDYVLTVEGEPGKAKLLNVFGGKITTYRRLAEAVLTRVDDSFQRKTSSWTAESFLPGGDFPTDGTQNLVDKLARDFDFLDTRTVARLVRAYGTTAFTILDDATELDDLGKQFGSGLSEREVIYLRDHEWAVSADDVLWRRSKLGLRLTEAERRQLDQWLQAHPPKPIDAAGQSQLGS
ncbi:MAG: glycerol-3-phosphate dehydrogenase [Hyphomicrobiaceae bacterium]